VIYSGENDFRGVQKIELAEMLMSFEFIHIAAALLFLLKIATGIWLRKSGRPFSSARMNLHKFIALGTVALIVMIIRRIYLASGANPSAVVLIILAGLLFLLAIITGGLVSLEKPAPSFVKNVHRAMPFLTALFTLLGIYLLL
jgi:hypothetical protein